MKTRPIPKNRDRHVRSKGMTLVEVMIAIVILGTGLLGTAMIQLKNTKYSHSSLMRSHMSMLAVEIVERMQINFDEAIGGTYDFIYTDPMPVIVDNCETSTAICTSVDLATYDLYQWRTRVMAVLPGGASSISTFVDPADPDPPFPPECFYSYI